jgi:hypothetical protein
MFFDYIRNRQDTYDLKIGNYQKKLTPFHRHMGIMATGLFVMIITSISGSHGLVDTILMNVIVLTMTMSLISHTLITGRETTYGRILGEHILLGLITGILTPFAIYGFIIACILNTLVVFEIRKPDNKYKQDLVK